MKFLVAIIILSSSNVFSAGGYEKPSLWSPRAVGNGGAYSSTVIGADAILYNPAALDKSEVGVNAAVFGGYLKAPVQNSYDNEKTNDDLVYSGGLVASYKMSDSLSLGFGAYGLAGLDTRYDQVNYGKDPAFNGYKKDYYGNLQAVEYSLGAALKLTSNLNFGFALRAQSFKANFGQTSVYRDNSGTPYYAVSAEFKDLEGNAFGSYRTGFQYRKETWGAGLTYRSSVKANVKGKSNGEIIVADGSGTVSPLPGGNVSIEAQIPQQVNFDVHYDVVKDKIRFLAGYSWTEYSKNKQLKMKGTFAGQELQNQNQNWDNMNDYKLGVSFLGRNTVSFGYTYTTPVTNKNYASPNSSPAGAYHHYGASLSSQLTANVSLDTALEYYHSQATAKSERIDGDMGTTTGGYEGNYSSGAWGAYMGMRYSFN